MFATAAFVMACIPLLAAIFVAMRFAFVDPDRLQSEEYNLRSRSLAMVLEAKGGPNLNPEALAVVAKPSAEPERLPPPADDHA